MTVRKFLSVAFTATVYDPAFPLTTPDMTPVVALIDRPLGTIGDGDVVHVIGAAPPVTGKDVGVIALHLIPLIGEPLIAIGSYTCNVNVLSILKPSQEDSSATTVNV